MKKSTWTTLVTSVFHLLSFESGGKTAVFVAYICVAHYKYFFFAWWSVEEYYFFYVVSELEVSGEDELKHLQSFSPTRVSFLKADNDPDNQHSHVMLPSVMLQP